MTRKRTITPRTIDDLAGLPRKKEAVVAHDQKMRQRMFRSEAEHLIGHVRQRSGHNRNERGYCWDCLQMIEHSLEWAYTLGKEGK